MRPGRAHDRRGRRSPGPGFQPRRLIHRLVIHADLPHDSEVLLHRSGRTGRAGRKGVSVLLVPSNRRRRAESLLAGAGLELFSEAAPSSADVRRLDEERLLADPLLSEEMAEDERESRLSRLSMVTACPSGRRQ